MERVRAYVRDGRRLPQITGYQAVIAVLKAAPDLVRILHNVEVYRVRECPWLSPEEWQALFFQFLEAMVSDGWVRGSLDPSQPRFEPERALPAHHGGL